MLTNRVVLSLFHALSEQWLSNEDFRGNAVKRTNEFINPFIKAGIHFNKSFAEKMELLLSENDGASRTQWMLTYLYVVILYRITFAKKGNKLPTLLLSNLKDIEVPMFSGCIMLCCIAEYLKENQSVRLVGDDVPAFSYLSSFLSLHTNSKNESSVDERFLRNRAGDLSFWLSTPMLLQNNYKGVGEPVVVTQDKALKKLIFRCLPCVFTENGAMGFSFDERSFEKVHSEEIKNRILSRVGTFNPTTDRKGRMRLTPPHPPSQSLCYRLPQWQQFINPAIGPGRQFL